MPRNAMGKVQRQTLAAEYGLGDRWPAAARTAILDQIERRRDHSRPIAAFDFDDTCIHGDIGIALLERLDARSTRDLVAEYEADCLENTRSGYAKLTGTLLAGRTRDEVGDETRIALQEAIQHGRIRWVDEVARLISTLHAHGWEVWIVTASPEVVVEIAAAQYAIPATRVIGMRAAVRAGRYTSEVLEPITYREGKLEALRQRCGADPLIAMGDSPSDEALLRAAEVGIVVDRGDSTLRERAHRAGWHIVEGW